MDLMGMGLERRREKIKEIQSRLRLLKAGHNYAAIAAARKELHELLDDTYKHYAALEKEERGHARNYEVEE